MENHFLFFNFFSHNLNIFCYENCITDATYYVIHTLFTRETPNMNLTMGNYGK